MMSWTDVATWVGTGLAVVSMGVAILQAVRARDAATRAEEMRDEIAKRNAHGELSGLNGALGAAIRAMDKYGPGAGSNARRGYSPDSDAAMVRALTGEMTRLRALLIEKFGNEVGNVIAKVNQLLLNFAAAPSDAQRVQYGCDIYSEIVEFSGNVKKELDGNIYG
jgi:hypothetical protein